MASQIQIGILKGHLLTVEKLQERVHRVLKCVINLHIEFLVIMIKYMAQILESHVAKLLDEVRTLNADLTEVKRLDTLIDTLRDYNGPTVCHEWPFPLIFKGTIENAELAQILNLNQNDIINKFANL